MFRIMFMIALVFAGEQVFGLPFHTQRFFKSTFLDVFNITNTQLGDLFAVYGVFAMIAYFPGGAVADRFSARALLTTSLFATGIGGLYMATIPGPTGLAFLYGYFGITTIFLFWAALIKATRDWGGDRTQGAAFGILESGRGLCAVLVSLGAIELFAHLMPADVRGATAEEQTAAFQAVIFTYSIVTMLAAALVWYAVPKEKTGADVEFNPLLGMSKVIRRPIVWATAGIIICAYCGFKGLDNYQLYAVQVLGKDEIEASRLVNWGAWTRIVAAVTAGLVADRFDSARSLGVIFGLLCVGYAVLSMAVPEGAGIIIIYLTFFLTYFAVFALRGIYFALLHENRTPKYLTGAAVGIISLVGYTPEVFFAPIAGRILDANPGLTGFHNYFLFLASIAASGIVLVLVALWLHRRGPATLWPGEHLEAK